MTNPGDHQTIAKLLHDACIKREAAELARAAKDAPADERLRREARELEKQAEALDPRHVSEAWIIEA